MSAPALSALDPVGLSELTELACLMTRVDRKYVLAAGSLDTLLDRLPWGSRALEIAGERSFGYRSTYLDLPGLTSFHDAAHRRRGRWKVRTRSYLDTGDHYLEVKTRQGEATRKERLPWWDTPGLDADGAAFVAARLATAGVRVDAHRLLPVLVTRYRRTTLLLPGSAARATIDTALEWSDAVGAARLSRPGMAIVETKTAGRPCALDAVLWAAGVRPVAVSKYATGLAALHPSLPRNRWHRLLAGDAFDSPRPGVRPLAGPTTHPSPWDL